MRRAGFTAALAALAAVAAAAAQAAPADGAGPRGVDPSVRPGDDFYAYANGVWLKSTPPPDGPGGRLDTTSALRAQNADRVRRLIRTADAAPARGEGAGLSAIRRKVADYHASRMATAAVEARGVAPLAADLAAIAAIKDRRGLAAYLGRATRLDDGGNVQTESLFGVWIHQGFHDPDHYAAHLVQGGLGLPEPADYLDPAAAARRGLYRAHVAALLAAAGLDQADVRAGRVVDLETAIARTHASRADTDDVYKTDNTWRAADFAAKAPGLDWTTYFAAAGLDRAPAFVVWQPGAVAGAAKLAAEQPLEAWRDDLAYHLIAHYAPVLPAAIREEARTFPARLAGAAAASASDPEAEAIAATEAALGEAVGRLYLASAFPPQAKAAAAEMAANLKAATRDHIQRAAWMAPPVKAKALAKLEGLRLGVGYPDAWIDYGGLTVVRGDAFGNLQRAEAFAYRRAVAKLARPVDPDEWPEGLRPQDVGAILDISPNSMQFAAGLLQPPYFDPTGDRAANYGSAGAGMAHEISHSFDELGRQYDPRGRLEPWWSDADLAAFRAALAPLRAQLDACCPAPGLCARGDQVLAESAADLAGLAVAHDAYIGALKGAPDVVKDGLTGEQRFFVAFAQRWRRLQGEAALRRQLETDSHLPAVCRSNLVRNSDAWVQAFAVKPGDKLFLEPAARVRIW